MRQLQFPAHALSLLIQHHQAGVLDRRSDQVRHGGDELYVGLSKGVLLHAIGEIDDAHGARRSAGIRIDNGHRQKRIATVGPIGGVAGCAVFLFWGASADRASFPEHPCGDGRLVFHGDGLEVANVNAPARNHPELELLRIIDEYGSASRTHHRTHFPHDHVGRLLQIDRTPEDFTDCVEEVDLFVPVRQLCCHLHRLSFAV